MTYVIAEPCVNTKDTACVEVCPVDCIHPKKDEPEFEAETKLYIDPETCIDCGACVPVCPVQAIFPRRSCRRSGRATRRWKSTGTPRRSSRSLRCCRVRRRVPSVSPAGSAP